MAFRWSVFAAAMFLSGTLCALCATYVLRRPGAGGRIALVVVLAASALWGLAYGVELGAVTRSAKEFWGTAKYLGVSALPPSWLVFALQYTGRERLVTGRLLAALAIEPVAVLAVMVAPATRSLVRSYPAGLLDPFPIVQLGPAFWALAAYSAVVVLVATGMLVLTLLRLSAAYRQQTRLLLGAIALVWTANLLSNGGVGTFQRVDPTPVALAIAGLMLVLGVFRFGLLDLVPVARTTLVETMSDAVLVLDAYHRVVDLNPAAQRVIGRPTSVVLGRRAEELLGASPAPVDFRRPRQELALPSNGGERAYEAVLSDLGDGRTTVAGHLLVLRDITERKRAERHLEHLAHYDSVTGLPNRKLFTDRLEQALARPPQWGRPGGAVLRPRPVQGDQ